MGRDITLIGMPRGGTTLACHLLNRCPQVAALSESMDVAALAVDNRTEAVRQVSAFMADARQELLRHGTALSKHRDGRIPDNSFVAAEGGKRSEAVVLGRVRFEARLEPGFTLFLKHNAAFTALLPELATNVESIGLVRHPLAVLASWNSLAMNASDGRAPAAERLDAALAARLQAEPDRARRQIVLLDWFFRRILDGLPAGRVIRYEDIVSTQGGALYACAGLSCGAQEAPTLHEMNANPSYGNIDVIRLASRLLAAPGAWQRVYPPESVEPLAQRMIAAGRRA